MSKSTMSRRAFMASATALASGATANVVAIAATKAAPVVADHDDPQAALARAEQVIDLLRTCYVCEGWTIDEAASLRALDYFRRMDTDSPDYDQEERAAMEFFHNHGQSLDWIFFGNPAGMICGAASHSARAAKDAFDPIFELIEQHRAAVALWESHHGLEAALQDEIPFERRKRYHVNDRDDPEIGRCDDPRWTDWQNKYFEFHDKMEDVAIEIIDTKPATVSGVIALLRYYVDANARGREYWPDVVYNEDDHPGQTDQLIKNRNTGTDGFGWHVFMCRMVAESLEAITSSALPLTQQMIGAATRDQLEAYCEWLHTRP